ncbi:uncharacterized protein LOC108336813 [Vigna angularis]|uniref:uncharacterized protein LOC108336813 n=1 Tax=Phaseolus angularis TaxID=3914 RepID=UPI0022B31451|nr:uncharacterized protein LOC108336813 [Vigna angularis]
MDEYLHMDSQVGSSLISDFSSFIGKVGEGDLTNKFTTNEIVRSQEHLITWLLVYGGRKAFVILGCERGGKYRKYKAHAVPSVYGTRKCECPFRLKGKPGSDGDGWVLKVVCGHHNHDLAETLVGHPYAGRLNMSEQSLLSNFTWAFEKLKCLFLTSEGGPKVIVTNRDLALMNVIANVFPESYQMLCEFHILKNVEAKCKMLVHSTKVWGVLMDAWQNVMDCNDESLFADTYFVKFWTNKVMHLENITTNRVEFFHWSLKKVLGNSMGDLCSCWDSIHNVVILQHNKIKASFERTRYDVGLIPLGEFHIMWRRLHFSNVELNETEPELSIKDESKQVQERFNEVDIGGKITIKQKLLEITCPTLTSMVPPLHKVKTKGAKKSKVQRRERSTMRDPSYFEYVDAFHSTIESSTVKSKLQSKPNVVKKKKVPMIDQFHSITHPFIVDVVDVVANGHCGYRCIAASLGLGEDSWPVIRNDLYKELSQWRDEYASLVGGYDKLEELRNSLLITKSQSMVNMNKWMTLPDIGYAIANRYNVILVCMSSSQNYTIFPLRSTPPSNINQHRLICIGHVHGCHFVQVKLQEDCPLPMVNTISSTQCYPEARAWSSMYTSRMQTFAHLMGVTTSYVDLGDA